MRLRLILAFSGILLVAVLAYPRLRDQWSAGTRGDRTGPLAARTDEAAADGTASVATEGSGEFRRERTPPVVAPQSAGPQRPLPPAKAAGLNLTAPAVTPDLDLAALGLTDPRKASQGERTVVRPKPGANPRSPAAPGFNPKAFEKRLDTLREDGPEHPYPAPEVSSDLDLDALGLTNPLPAARREGLPDRKETPDGKDADPKSAPRPPAEAGPGVGRRPDEVPPWWKELDADKDGQIGLYEWRRAGRPVEEFERLDLNKDGLLTTEEYTRAAKATRPPARAGGSGK